MKPLLTVLFFIIITTGGLLNYYSWRIIKANKTNCIANLSNCNKAIESFGVFSNSREIWDSPEVTKEYIAKIYPDAQLATCPSGGELTIEHLEHRGLSELSCSLEESHQHGLAYSSKEFDSEMPIASIIIFFPSWVLSKVSSYEAVTILGLFLSLAWLWFIAHTASRLSIHVLPSLRKSPASVRP